MKGYLFAAILVTVIAAVVGEDKGCFRADLERDAAVKACKEAEKETLKVWKCFMTKMKVIVDGVLKFGDLHEIIDRNVVGKRQELNKAVNDCMEVYDNSTDDKIKDFYDCYSKEFVKNCPLGI